MLTGLNDFFDLSPEMFCISNINGNFIKVNQAFLKRTGYSEDELKVMSFYDFTHTDDKKVTKKAFDSLIADQSTLIFKNRFHCKDNTYKYFHWSAYSHKKTGLFYFYVWDNTDIKHTEDMSRSAIEASPSGVIMVETDGTITMANMQMEKYFGYTRDELIGLQVEKLIPINQVKHEKYRRDYLKNPKTRPMGAEMDLSAIRKDGKTFPVEIGLNPVHINENTFIMATITDITERKIWEEKLRSSKDEAEKANSLKSDFLNLMSHELRTPLTVMLGNLPLLTNPEDLPDNVDIAEIATDIEDSGKHLLALINDLLDVSKIEAGKLELNLITISVKDLVRSVLTKMKILSDAKGLQLGCEIEDCEITADLRRMKQILMNLLSNAIKFTDKGGVLVKAYKESNQVIFEVQDSGCGMNKEDIPLLFNMFQQVDNSTTRKAHGSGLGLLITKRLVNLHGWNISVESELNQGSTFRIIIPC